MAPPPRKPTPAATPLTMLARSGCSAGRTATSANNAEPTPTRMCVRNPAVWLPRSRSQPIRPANTAATVRRISTKTALDKSVQRANSDQRASITRFRLSRASGAPGGLIVDIQRHAAVALEVHFQFPLAIIEAQLVAVG